MHEQLEAAERMVRHQLRARGVRDPAVLEAMTQVPRHRFVSEADAADAYADKALPTADGQTISQPYMVAVMTEQLRIEPGVKVLEVGTGSGYQAAILAHMGAQVVSIERSETLARQARDVLGQLGWSDRVRVVVGDGTLGYPQEAPYDR
ncbi:MAG: methyltransferase domain-containing protein, partial [Phycisphaeraceae bacterium]